MSRWVVLDIFSNNKEHYIIIFCKSNCELKRSVFYSIKLTYFIDLHSSVRCGATERKSENLFGLWYFSFSTNFLTILSIIDKEKISRLQTIKYLSPREKSRHTICGQTYGDLMRANNMKCLFQSGLTSDY